MERLSPQAKFRWNLTTFIIFLFLTVCDILARLYSPPAWFSNWPHWNWQDWTSLGGDLFFPIMALVSLLELRKRRRSQRQ
jgi:hypothetical protein